MIGSYRLSYVTSCCIVDGTDDIILILPFCRTGYAGSMMMNKYRIQSEDNGHYW